MTQGISTEEWFARLSTKRRTMIDSIHENEADGLLHSTADKYADPAHFVFELLQNAEDQGATSAMFVLKPTELVFSHNGSAFTRPDVESITNVGNSRKPQQANKIGRFGIGFKSVFAITRRPEVQTFLDTTPFSFAIEDYMVPVALPASGSEDRVTQFTFPFLTGDEETLYTTIQEKLQGLGADTLLFLDHLKSVHWQTGDGDVTLRCQRDQDGAICHLTEETANFGGIAVHSHVDYRVYAKRVQMADADRTLTVRLAFRLEDGRLVCEPGLCIANVYFPTKEKTGLRFRLHAPFLLNDSRANIKENNPANRQLIHACADLLTEALPDLRDRDLLTAEALECLPLREEDFPARREFMGRVQAEAAPFRPLYDAVRTAFLTQELLPTATGSSRPYVGAAAARISDSRPLRQLFGEAQLTALSRGNSQKPVCWVSEKIAKNITRDIWEYLTKALGIDDLDGEKVARQLDGPFLEAQTDDWMARFYVFLLDQSSLWRARTTSAAGPLRSKPIIRVEPHASEACSVVVRTAIQVAPFVGEGATPNVYLGSSVQADFRLVKFALQRLEGPHRFLTALGLKAPDVAEYVIKTTLPRYASSVNAVTEEDFAADLDLIAQAVGTEVITDRSRLDVALLNARFVKAVNAADPTRTAWKTPQSVYLPEAEIVTWFGGNPDIWFPHEEVLTHPRWDMICNFMNRMRPTIPSIVRVKARRPGPDNHVPLVERYGDHRRGLNRFDPEANIEGLKYALEHITVSRARILWRLLLASVSQIEGAVEEATYKNFVNGKRRDQESVLGHLVRSHAWLPDADSGQSGLFHTPNEISLGHLADDLRVEVNALELSVALGMSQPAEEEAADKLGVPVDALAAFVNAYKRDPEIMKRFALYAAPPEFPSHSVPDPERRMVKATEQAINAPAATFDVKNRSVRISPNGFRADMRAYLRYFYETDDGDVLCQVCSSPMPFRLDDGTHYFEAVACLKHFPTDHVQNHLALCPVCAAKYQHANGQGDESWRDAIATATGFEITTVLARQEVQVHFVQPHLVDLKAMLHASDQQMVAETEPLLSINGKM